MKVLFTILIGLLALTSIAQNNQSINLRWKIGKSEKLRYITGMKEIDTSTMEMNFGGLFKALSDSSKKGLDESRAFFRKLNQEIKNLDFITTLSNKGNGVIEIVMATKPKDETKNKDDSDSKDLLTLMTSMNQGVVLRGSVYETGDIHSFWVKSGQKNIIAFFFQLPNKPVKIGDKWPLDISLIENDQNFACDTSYKLNEVSLTDIKYVNRDTIAVLKYNIEEYVKGDFYSPGLYGNKASHQETMLKFMHQGVAEFSVTKGRWVSYDGIMSVDASGVLIAHKKSKFTLIKM